MYSHQYLYSGSQIEKSGEIWLINKTCWLTLTKCCQMSRQVCFLQNPTTATYKRFVFANIIFFSFKCISSIIFVLKKIFNINALLLNVYLVVFFFLFFHYYLKQIFFLILIEFDIIIIYYFQYSITDCRVHYLPFFYLVRP